MRQGKRTALAAQIATYLADGYTAKVVGGEPLAGAPAATIATLNADGIGTTYHTRPRLSTPGIHLTSPTGYTILVITRNRQDAQQLLTHAQTIPA